MLKRFRCKKMSDYHVVSLSPSHLFLSLKSASDIQLTDFRCRIGTISNFQLNIFTDTVTSWQCKDFVENYIKCNRKENIGMCRSHTHRMTHIEWHTCWHTCWHIHVDTQVDTHMLECHPQHNETIPWDVSWAEREKVKVELMLTSPDSVYGFSLYMWITMYHVVPVSSHVQWKVIYCGCQVVDSRKMVSVVPIINSKHVMDG